jgi:hypothetical protein
MPCPYFNKQTFAQRFKDAFLSLLIYSIHGNFVVLFALDSISTRKDLHHAPIDDYLDGAYQPSSLTKYKILNVNMKCTFKV